MSDLPAICDRLVKAGLAGLIAFTPLAFGTVESWSIAVMEWGVVSLLLVHFLGALWPTTRPANGWRRSTGLAVPLGLFLALGVAQTLPIPYEWLEVVSPGSARMYADPAFADVAAARRASPEGGPGSDPLLRPAVPSSRPVSVNPPATRARVLLLAVFVALFGLVVRWASQGPRIVFLAVAVTVVGSLVGFVGLVQHLTWNGGIYWFREVPRASTFGPFVNHNHFAGYVGMVIPVAICLVFHLIEIGRQPGAGTGRLGDTPEASLWGQAALAFFASVILVLTLILSRSRGGLVASLISAVVLFALLWPRIHRPLVKWTVVLTLPALVVGMVVWIGADVFQQQVGSIRHMEGEASFRLRVMVWKQVARHLPDFLWVGSGLGTFEESFAPFTPPGSAHRWDMAHNDYLQILWEAGLVGIAFLVAGLAIFFFKYWRPALTRRQHPLEIFRVGIAVALLSVALHSIVDFNLQIGANGFLCAVLAAMLVALDRLIEPGSPRGPVLVRGSGGTA